MFDCLDSNYYAEINGATISPFIRKRLDMTEILDAEKLPDMNDIEGKLTRLQTRAAKLKAEAEMLNARAKYLEGVRRGQAKQLLRRQRTHEAVVLGVLAKKAGLDDFRVAPNAGEKPTAITETAATYDRELILGAMLWLHSALSKASLEMVQVPELRQLRDLGKTSLNRRGLSAKKLVRSIATPTH